MKKILFTFIIISISLISMQSCSKLLDLTPDSSNLPVEQTFKNKDDALNAFNGCYALMQNVVDQIYIAGEMQGELVSPARGCDSIPFLKQILNNDVTPQNPYTDYLKFYKLIAACNGAIKGYDKLTSFNPDFKSELRDLYKAHAIVIRSWAYLQLVKIWGNVPYISDNVFTIDSLKDVAASPLNDVLGNVANDLKSQLPMSDVWDQVVYNNNKFTNVTARMLMAEIYTWMGQYENAYDVIKKFLPFQNNPYLSVDGSQVFFSLYESFRPAGTEWIRRFTFPFQTLVAAQFIVFDGSRGQKNSIVRWCNNQGNSSYAIKPSSWSIKNWAMQPRDSMLCWLQPMNRFQNWPELPNKGPLASKLTGDWFRGGGGTYTNGNDTYTVTAGSYMVDGTDTIIYKPLVKTPTFINVSITPRGNNPNGTATFPSTVKIYSLTRRSVLNLDPYTNDDLQYGLWGEGWVQLWTAEILNQVGRSREALTILNTRGGNLSSIRRRVGLFPIITDVVEDGNLKRKVDDAILSEMSLESAFEGYRWFDLVRFARRYNDPTILANTVAKKYPASKQALIQARLSDPNRWFFPYYYKNVQANKLLSQKQGY